MNKIFCKIKTFDIFIFGGLLFVMLYTLGLFKLKQNWQ